MHRWALVLLLLALGVPSCPPLATAGGDEDELAAVSMVQLVVRPGPYVGRRIEVVGYLGVDGKLYLTKDHASARDAMSSIAVSDTDEGEIAGAGCAESYVRLRGRLSELDGLYPIVADVESVFQPTRGKMCWARKE